MLASWRTVHLVLYWSISVPGPLTSCCYMEFPDNQVRLQEVKATEQAIVVSMSQTSQLTSQKV